jgi:hypothetical protein
MSPKTIKLCLDLSSVLTSALTAIAAFPWETGTQPFPAEWRPWILKIGIGSTIGLRVMERITAYLKSRADELARSQPPQTPVSTT